MPVNFLHAVLTAVLHGPEPSKAMFVVNFQEHPWLTGKRRHGQKN